jgi:hypothetical protein
MPSVVAVIGEAHIGLTRFFKNNKANAPPPPPIVEKTTPQPKSLGLSKRMVSKNSLASQDLTQNSQSGSSSNSATIGDGQSYVNPELFRHPTANIQSTGTAANFTLYLYDFCSIRLTFFCFMKVQR